MTLATYILWAQRAACFAVLMVLLGIDLLPFWSSLSIFPTLPLIGIFYLFIFRADVMTLEVLILLGIIQDGIYGYPLGLSILANILIYGLLFTQRRFIDKKSFLFLWGTFGAFVLISYGIHWGLLSFARHEMLNFLPRLLGLVMTVALFPLVSFILSYGRKEGSA